MLNAWNIFHCLVPAFGQWLGTPVLYRIEVKICVEIKFPACSSKADKNPQKTKNILHLVFCLSHSKNKVIVSQ